MDTTFAYFNGADGRRYCIRMCQDEGVVSFWSSWKRVTIEISDGTLVLGCYDGPIPVAPSTTVQVGWYVPASPASERRIFTSKDEGDAVAFFAPYA